MALTLNRMDGEVTISKATASIGASPAAVIMAAPRRGYIRHVLAFSEGASTGTVTITVQVAAKTALPTFSFTGGTSAFGTGDFSQNINSSVNEGDLITVTPSGGGGASIAGDIYVIIRGS